MYIQNSDVPGPKSSSMLASSIPVATSTSVMGQADSSQVEHPKGVTRHTRVLSILQFPKDFVSAPDMGTAGPLAQGGSRHIKETLPCIQADRLQCAQSHSEISNLPTMQNLTLPRSHAEVLSGMPAHGNRSDLQQGKGMLRHQALLLPSFLHPTTAQNRSLTVIMANQLKKIFIVMFLILGTQTHKQLVMYSHCC